MAVAAVLYLDGTAASVEPGCADAVCAVDALVRQAAAAGAKLIVAPEYALPQPTAEAVPAVGEVPTTRLLEQFAATADAVDAFVVVQLLTEDGGERFNSQVALGPDGTVRAVHHKVELYGDERRTLAPGEGPTTFDTPFGRVGMLVCADLYADPALHVGLVQAGIDIVAVSERWTVPGAAQPGAASSGRPGSSRRARPPAPSSTTCRQVEPLGSSCGARLSSTSHSAISPTNTPPHTGP